MQNSVNKTEQLRCNAAMTLDVWLMPCSLAALETAGSRGNKGFQKPCTKNQIHAAKLNCIFS